MTVNIKNCEGVSIDSFVAAASKAELLTTEDVNKLTKAIRQGDTNAKDRLVTGYMRFIVSVSKPYLNRGLTFWQLIDAGRDGLIKAAEMYNEEQGFKFISFAVWWIRTSMLKALTDASMNEETGDIASPFLLNEREYAVLHATKDAGLTDSETGLLLDLTVERVKQIRERAINKLNNK